MSVPTDFQAFVDKLMEARPHIDAITMNFHKGGWRTLNIHTPLCPTISLSINRRREPLEVLLADTIALYDENADPVKLKAKLDALFDSE